MGFRFFKSIKIMDGLRLNISKNGIGFSSGVKGAHISTNAKGTYLNLSLPGTGLGYTQKLVDKGVGVNFKDLFNKKNDQIINTQEKKQVENKVNQTALVTNEDSLQIVNNYHQLLEINTCLYKQSANVVSKDVFDKSIEQNQNKEQYQKLIDGDEDAIENIIAQFLQTLQLDYQTNVNYELEDHILFVDIDLPEIEMLEKTYPTLMQDGKLLYKEKSLTTLKQEYCDTVLSLPIYLAASFFNLSSYITEICISGYSQRRNNLGDAIDDYIYSIRFTREIFENTDLQELSKPYNFIQRFTNRINYQINGNFKTIVPYENPISNSQGYSDLVLSETITGLKNLGYSDKEIKPILDKITNLESTDTALKQALQLLVK